MSFLCNVLDQMQKTAPSGRWIEEVKYSRFTFVERTINNSPKHSRGKFQGSDGFFWFGSICKFGTHSLGLLACLNFTLNSEDLFCWHKEKKWFLSIMAATQADENHGDEWGLTWYFRWGIYTSIATWAHLNKIH